MGDKRRKQTVKHKEKDKSEKKDKKRAHNNGEVQGQPPASDKQASGQRKKVKKENKDGIKKPLSAYMLYNNFRRPILRKEHPSRFQTLDLPL